MATYPVPGQPWASDPPIVQLHHIPVMVHCNIVKCDVRNTAPPPTLRLHITQQGWGVTPGGGIFSPPFRCFYEISSLLFGSFCSLFRSALKDKGQWVFVLKLEYTVCFSVVQDNIRPCWRCLWCQLRCGRLDTISPPALCGQIFAVGVTLDTLDKLIIRHDTAANDSSVFTITEKAPSRAFSWLKAPTRSLSFKSLLRHYVCCLNTVSRHEIRMQMQIS